MKLGFLILVLTTAACFVAPAAHAAQRSGTKPAKTAKSTNGHLGTNFDFEDQIVRGKYEYPDEAVATVEDDKMLNDLLTVRKEFKDRLREMEK